MDFLKRKGVAHTAAVVTKIKFDARTAYPKLLFGAHGWTPQTDTANIKTQLAAKDVLERLLHAADLIATAPEAPAPEAFEAPPAKAAAASPPDKAVEAPKPRPAPAKAAAPEVDPDDMPASFGKVPVAAANASPVVAKAPRNPCNPGGASPYGGGGTCWGGSLCLAGGLGRLRLRGARQCSGKCN